MYHDLRVCTSEPWVSRSLPSKYCRPIFIFQGAFPNKSTHYIHTFKNLLIINFFSKLLNFFKFSSFPLYHPIFEFLARRKCNGFDLTVILANSLTLRINACHVQPCSFSTMTEPAIWQKQTRCCWWQFCRASLSFAWRCSQRLPRSTTSVQGGSRRLTAPPSSFAVRSERDTQQGQWRIVLQGGHLNATSST